MSANEHQVGGDHYASKAVQPWDAMESWMSAEAFSGYLQGNCIKYLSRYREKNGVEDLKKAKHYLSKLIEIEGESLESAHFQAGRHSALAGFDISRLERSKMPKDWLEGYDQTRADSNG